ncbi:MAG TPA: oligopeptide/dipeptide ABC transporter ATP-binding protein [Trueperaceae bacterium]
MLEPGKSSGGVLLEVSNLTVEFPTGRGQRGESKRLLRAVDGVSLTIERGETLGLVGESGSGKTTFGRALLRVVPATQGRVRYFTGDGRSIEVLELDRRGLRGVWREMQMIFQDPYSSLNPRMTVADIIGEPLVANRLAKGARLSEKVRDIAIRCGLSPEHLGRHPHAFSGGQRQRIAIARSLVLEPSFVVCDEAVSSLDVSIQSQILNLLSELQRDLGFTYLFIAHDLSVVSQVSDRVAVMYLGRIVEIGPTEAIFRSPRHPYTEALLSAIPMADPDTPMKPRLLTGELPDPADPPSGCPFRTRCRFAVERCATERPELVEVGPKQAVACHFFDQFDLQGAIDHAPGSSPL